MSKSVEKHDTTLPPEQHIASGHPGAKPRWTSSAKTAVGTALSNNSRVWFTLGQGVLNEVYFPDIDKANTRRMRFLVTDGEAWFSDEQVDAEHETEQLAEGVPAYRMTATCKQGRYRLQKEIFAPPERSAITYRVTFDVLDGSALQLYVTVEPHLGDEGEHNTAWVGDYKGERMLLAGRADKALAVYASVPIGTAVAGFVGEKDGYGQLRKNYTLEDHSNLAKDGNVSLTGQLRAKPGESFVLTLAFGSHSAEAAQQARAAVLSDFDKSLAVYTQQWQRFQESLLNLKAPEGSDHNMYRISTAVLRTHESKEFPGGFIASLSLPWGFARGDKDAGAYHVLWPRDLCETAMGLMACGDFRAGRRALFYLACTQEGNGSWSQNMWLDGTMHWGAVQMDGIAMPILLADQLRRDGQLEDYDAWPMIRKACSFLLKQGPSSQQDRWEALPGYAVFTVACEVAALLAAADFADLAGETAEASFLRETADAWNDVIDLYLYAQGTTLAEKYGVDGYYVRIAPDKIIEDPDLNGLWIHLENHIALGGLHKVVNVVSPDALALTRFGLRSANDPRMVATAKVIDGELKKQLATGPGWRRSTDDGYGEHADGSPYNGHGVGRCWPLLAGERGHFELAAGNKTSAKELLVAMSRQTSERGMLPEQVWDADDLPDHQLFNGHPAGSGMPLAWAHAEYIKLLRSCTDGAVYDTPPQPMERYQVQKVTASCEIWTEQERRGWVSKGKHLRMDFGEPTILRCSIDGQGPLEVETGQPYFGRHSVIISLPACWKKINIHYGVDRQVTLRCRTQ